MNQGNEKYKAWLKKHRHVHRTVHKEEFTGFKLVAARYWPYALLVGVAIYALWKF